MKILAMDAKFDIYKFSLNKRERTLRVYLKTKRDKHFYRHVIARGLTVYDVKSIEESSAQDLLTWVKNDMSCYFSIWR